MKNDDRFKDSVAAKLNNLNNSEDGQGNTQILLSPSDQGVIRNRGRNGSRFAPQAILSVFKKLNSHLDKIDEINTAIVSSEYKEKLNFESAQIESSQLIHKRIKHKENIIHIGGGHDHVYPLLLAIDKLNKFKEIIILNIDAHCDTRVDNTTHSGTPFRDFDSNLKTPTRLYQIGIHNFANSNSTFTKLKNIDQEIVFQNQIDSYNFKELISSFSKDSAVVLSLDADGLDSSIMKAVSAVNPNGVHLNILLSIIDSIKENKLHKFFGIYEYNPIYDDLSNQGARILSHLMYRWLE